MINFLTSSLKCKKLKLILSILFLLSFCFTKSQKETLTINIPKNLESIHTGYPVYHITANTDGSKLYFYNKLNAYNTGLYIYGDGSLVNINDQQSNPEHGIETAIGDCIYNPYTDHFLVSENSDYGSEAAKIKVFNSDINNSYITNISLTDNGVNAQYPKKMFIAPNQKLYVMANMHNDPTVEPKVFIYNTNDYTLLETHELTMPVFNDTSEFYSAHFCYNPHNQTVYASIHPTEITLDPYHTVPNSMFDFDEPFETDNKGLFIKFEDNQITIYDDILYPGKIICPDIGNSGIVSQYNGKMFIIGKEFVEYDYVSGVLEPEDIHDQPFNDITYSAFHDKLFAIKDVEDECINDRKCGIYSIDYENNSIVFNYLGYIDGQASSIFSNPYDGNVYIYNKIDDEKLGGTEAKLFYFDPSVTFSLESINLGITSFYPELDHNNDYHYYFYNITTPYINPYTNHIYLPNGGHSSVSVVDFEANEAMYLSPGNNWISIPRHNRPTDPEWTLIENVFDKDNFTEGYDILELSYLNAFFTPAWAYSAEWEYGDWTYVPDEDDAKKTFSTRGYQLDLQQTVSNTLIMNGTVEDPNTSIELYVEKDNWVGYFLYQEQDVFDALADVIDDIYMIKAQYWTCVYTIPCARNANNQGGCWIWDNEVHNVKYGDMLILNTYSDFSFQWNYSGNLSNEEPRAAPEYYSYEEKADYTPMLIELDSTVNLLEIGAFINDSCIGANTVLTDDTIVVLRAYMDGQPGDSVTFEKYYGTSKAYNPPINNYFVNNKQKGTWEKRTIKTGEKHDYYLISFKTGKITNETQSNPISLSCAPNPFKNEVTIKFTVQQECMLQIGVYDLYGKSLNILQQSVSKAGNYSINWTGTDRHGKPLPNGVYILKLRAGTNYAQTKIVIMK